MSLVKATAFNDTSESGNAVLYGVAAAQGGMNFRNRIINGDMRIDQRNAGASVNFGGGIFPVDRMRFSTNNTGSGVASGQQNLNSITPPAGFINYLGVTVTTASTMGASEAWRITQRVEGYTTADFDWGTANAKTVTLSFWVRSNLTGTFGGCIQNSAGNRFYVFSYTINLANTWEYKTVTIAGDTSGTWLTTNGIGLMLFFSVGCGTSVQTAAGSWGSSGVDSVTGQVNVLATIGNTFYITGVQLEVGTVATPFERRPYGTELALCQRYYYRASGIGPFVNGYNMTTTTATGAIPFPVPLRTSPTALEQTGTAANYRIVHGATVTTCSAVPYFEDTNTFCGRVVFTVASGLTAGQGCMLYTAGATTAYLAWSAEL